MTEGLEELTEKEREALRLLLAGHEAKSIARELDLSVYTINDRLRSARRKLGTSSSREAARLLGEAEGSVPQLLAGKDLGLGGPPVVNGRDDGSQPRPGRSVSLAWLAGGMLVMSLLIGTAIVLLTLAGGEAATDSRPATSETPTISTQASQARALDAALAWLAIVDRDDWDESWRQASAAFRSQASAAQWRQAVVPVRAQIGAFEKRSFTRVTQTTVLPGAPVGNYEVIEFRSHFAAREQAVETIVMTHKDDEWKVVGYFVR